MTGKYNRSYINCWDQPKIQQTLESRLYELKNKVGKSKSRIKLLRSKISRLTRALEGRAVAGGQIRPQDPYKIDNMGPNYAPNHHTRPFGPNNSANDPFSEPPGGYDHDGFTVTDETHSDGHTMENEQFSENFTQNYRDFSTKHPNFNSFGNQATNFIKKKTKKVCFRCRKRGHLLKDCRENPSESICFKCGSTEHILKNCPQVSDTPLVGPNGDPQQIELPFASCFICSQTGHLSSQCPQNPKGMFPKGSGCFFCGSVRHKKAFCPLLKRGPHMPRQESEYSDFNENSHQHQQPE